MFSSATVWGFRVSFILPVNWKSCRGIVGLSGSPELDIGLVFLPGRRVDLLLVIWEDNDVTLGSEQLTGAPCFHRGEV